MGRTSSDKSKPKRQRKLPPKDSEEYRQKRDKNNDAVRKSRDKSRSQASAAMERMQRLKEENEALELQVQILAKELGVLKDLFTMVHQDTAVGASTSAAEQRLPVKYEDNDMKVECEVEIGGASCEPASFVEVHDGGTSCAGAPYDAYDGTAVNMEAVQKDHMYHDTVKRYR